MASSRPGRDRSPFPLRDPRTPRFLLTSKTTPVKAEFDATQLVGETSMGSEMEARPVVRPLPDPLSFHGFASTKQSDARPPLL